MTPRPTFALSLTGAPLLSVAKGSLIAEHLDLAGIEISLPRRFGPRDPASLAHNAVSAIWLPGNPRAMTRQLEQWAPLVHEQPRCLVVMSDPEPLAVERPAASAIEAVTSARRLLGDSARIAIGIRAHTMGLGRHHLDRIKLLRAFGGEWQFGLAIDLARASDWQWEAEAAVLHAGNRLDLIRVTLPMPTFDAHIRSRLTERTLRASIDAGFVGTYAIAPGLPFWRPRSASLLDARTDAALQTLRAWQRLAAAAEQGRYRSRMRPYPTPRHERD